MRLVTAILPRLDGSYATEMVRAPVFRQIDVGVALPQDLLLDEIKTTLSKLESPPDDIDDLMLMFARTICDGVYHVRHGGIDIHIYKLVSSCCQFCAGLLAAKYDSRSVWSYADNEVKEAINVASWVGVGLDSIHVYSMAELLSMDIINTRPLLEAMANILADDDDDDDTYAHTHIDDNRRW